MRHQFLTSLAVAALALAAAPAIHAQSRLIGTVPFEFTANHSILPAGPYEVFRRGEFWQLRSEAKGHRSLFVTGSPKLSGRDDPAELVFECRGAKCDLREIQMGGGLVGYYVPRAHRSRSDAEELARLVVVKLHTAAGE